MDRLKLDFQGVEGATSLLDSYMSEDRPLYVIFDYGDGTRVEVQFSPMLGIAARASSGKWSEPWQVCSRDEVEELLAEAARYRPLYLYHVLSNTEYMEDHHAADPLHFAERRRRGESV